MLNKFIYHWVKQTNRILQSFLLKTIAYITCHNIREGIISMNSGMSPHKEGWDIL